MEPARLHRLPDGRRAHLWHGPIDIILEAFGPTEAVAAAHAAAFARFATILDELCAELPLLRAAAAPGAGRPAGRVARRMHAAVLPFAAQTFITPMAAVAGAVAEEVLESTLAVPGLERVYVNNGGDIALHLSPTAHFDLGIVDIPEAPRLAGSARIAGSSTVRGIATSGWRGRSFSLGIADAVTVLAATASMADAAATVIANAVDLPGHPAIMREPASHRQPDSDLGDRLVTVGVGPLGIAELDAALARGHGCARRLLGAGRIAGAALFLGGRVALAGMPQAIFQPPAAAARQPAARSAVT